MQQTLLATVPRTSVLRTVDTAPPTRILQVRCERSLPFEFVSELMRPFLGLSGLGIQVTNSDYDPSLAGVTLPARDEDVLLLWIDWRLHVAMPPADAARWIAGLVGDYRQRSARAVPVLFNDWPQGGEGDVADVWARGLSQALEEVAKATPDCHVIGLEKLHREDCPDFFDARNDAIAHYPFSNAATVHLARHLGAQVLPALFLPRLKVLAMDLDHTMYGGVLGEDGVEGVRIGPGHLTLQKTLLRLKAEGYILALCSRNERVDVDALFAKRQDFAVSLADFTAVRVDWGSKADNLRSIAAELNLHPSAILFVDDNPAELTRVAQAAPEVELVLADPQGEVTAAVLSRHPGLFRLRADAAAGVRNQDLKANQEREQLRATARSTAEYLTQLEMIVDIYENAPEHSGRVHELSNKTNQFNLTLARMNEQEVARLGSGGNVTFTVGLRDSLADSGIVAVLAFEIAGREARLAEFLMSCRALGRDVEAVALLRALDRLGEMGCEWVRIEPKEGPRNQPALTFWRRFIPGGEPVLAIGQLRKSMDQAIGRHPAEVRIHR